MATIDSQMGAYEIYGDAEGSDPDSYSDDTESDPDFDIIEETYRKFSNFSIEKKKAKARIFEGEVLGMEIDSEELEMNEPGLDENDEKNFGEVQKIIEGDACTGDVVLFEQNVYEMFSIVSRSASGPPSGKRIVAGRIVKESYGAAKQQHAFTELSSQSHPPHDKNTVSTSRIRIH